MTYRQPLPIDEHLEEIAALVQKHGTVVLSAAPGTGKTTRVPPALLDFGVVTTGEIIVLQPRRLAARSIATRIAHERGCPVGQEIGYQIRFDNKTSKLTKIRIVTEGILLRLLQVNPFLDGIGAVILDEFHERSLYSDVIVALLREIKTEVRRDLFVVVMSATLDTEPILRFLDNATLKTIPGKQFPLEIRYVDDRTPLPMVQRAVVETRRLVEQLDHDANTGHVLVFLPGVAEIRRAITAFLDSNLPGNPLILALHGRQTPDEQDMALKPTSRRKIIVTTNIAETSLTVDGVVAVVDSGWEKVNRYDTRTGIDHLELGRISKASADQRAGRAARTQPGIAIRCWTRAEQATLVHFSSPEIRRVDLTTTVLELLHWGCAEPAHFGWFEAPNPEALTRSVHLARLLGAIDPSTGALTALGKVMLPLPVHPRISRMLIEAAKRNQHHRGVHLAALLSEISSRPTETPQTSRNDWTSDLSTVIYDATKKSSPWARTVSRIRDDLGRILDTIVDLPPRNTHKSAEAPIFEMDETICRLVLLAYPDRVAKKRQPLSEHALMVGGHGILTSHRPDNPDDPDDLYFVAVELQGQTGLFGRSGDPRVKTVCPIRPEWLEQDLPHAITTTTELQFSAERRSVVVLERKLFLDLPLHERIKPAPPGPETSTVLAQAAAFRIDEIAPLVGPLGVLVTRGEWLRRTLPELNFPSLLEYRREAVITMCDGKRSFSELVGIDWAGLIHGSLSYETRAQLDHLAPLYYTTSSGRKAPIDYCLINDHGDPDSISPPTLAVKLQEMFGVRTTPTIANGKIPLLLHLLAPNGRPAQVTQDLPNFWKTTYSDVRKELRGRYPKYHWPDDPTTASFVPPRRRSPK